MKKNYRLQLLTSALSAIIILFAGKGNAQTYFPVTHFIGTQSVGGNNVTVSYVGTMTSFTACPAGFGPYQILANGTSITYAFATPVSSVKIPLVFDNEHTLGRIHFKVNAEDQVLTPANLSGVVAGSCDEINAAILDNGDLVNTGMIDNNPSNTVRFTGTISSVTVALTDVDDAIFSFLIEGPCTPPTISDGQDVSICNGGFTTLTATGGATYSWSPSLGLSATTGSSVSAHPAATTTYTVTGTTGSCSSAAQVTVSVTTVPAITGVASASTAGYTQLSDAASGGMWTVDQPGIATVDGTTGLVGGVSAGTTSISYILPGGCSTSIPVTVHNAPTNIYCVGQPVELTDTFRGGTWTTSVAAVATVGPTSGIVTGITPGTTIIRHLYTGYLRTYTVTISPLSQTTGNASVCAGSSITLGNNTTGGGVWSSSNTTVAVAGAGGVITGLDPGVAAIYFTTTAGCIATKSVTVNASARISGAASVCVGQTATVADPIPGGTWSSNIPAIISINANSGLMTGVNSGSAVISYILPTGCIRTATITSNPISATTGAAAVCQGLSVTLANNTANGGAWSSSSTAIALVGSASGVVTGAGAGQAVISFTSSRGCVATKTVTVTGSPQIFGLSYVCVSSIITLSSDINGGTWSSNIPAMAGTNPSNNGRVTGVSAGSPVITYGVPGGCYKTTTVTVYPMVQTTGPSTVCQGHTITLANSTAGGGTWSSANSVLLAVDVNTGIVTGLAAGTASIYFATGHQCLASKPITVNICASREANSSTSVAETLPVVEELALFPNPNNGSFTIEGALPVADDQHASITVLNMLGQVVYKKEIQATNGNINEQISLGNALANGTYMLDARSGTGQKVFHFVIRK